MNNVGFSHPLLAPIPTGLHWLVFPSCGFPVMQSGRIIRLNRGSVAQFWSAS
ncbi:hypothetical protein BIFGAL_03226 [Bifidobacterium gallicum DSM 20093 = LMG 11596]|uniref:Uncharacterized protein n=1 Tax=Bifidobacterium gallicum DSM 20093 = LMG 11596 TaxID=561180 RepID=D1NTR0_9BIFI|nr:hypothetical protein BIFGAL_03226 [Bifidobacterium gallicum DSM 20093 = LMG 11596]